MYDQSNNHPDWRTSPTLARAHPFRKGAGRVRILRHRDGAWSALYAVEQMGGGGGAAADAAAAARRRPGRTGAAGRRRNVTRTGRACGRCACPCATP